MRRELEFLRSQKNDINVQLKNVPYGKKPKEVVENWLKNMEDIEKEVHSLGSVDAHHMCFKGFCPNYYTRLKRSKKIAEILETIRDLKESGKLFAQRENIFIDSPPETSSGFPVTTLHGTSAERKKEEILQWIKNPVVGKIGVYGMGGVGKTTIMTQIYNELNKDKFFDILIW
ncbi:probable disease resistance protein At1g61310 [Dioscorea cayenensis subsp. rotundata]|uniref:Probable disease resistance protein At1g61310 n=1 Tax=Dioscorea cayennensis subsp. rotundata TaxID=55577 RepID=A0AB40C4T5_DIOCR|nr:probable disease resistance protein At1g61310 [Dioscorea cayenensis subsp. rotundata]